MISPDNHSVGSQINELDTFEDGQNGWEFRFWMPNGRPALAAIRDNVGFRGTKGLALFADGRDDDGIVFIQKVFSTPKPFTYACVSWGFAPYDPKADMGAWPRVVYAGALKDLARSDTQHDFVWYSGSRNLITLPNEGNWHTQFHIEIFKTPVAQLQVCLGWKINWETERELFLDNVIVLAG